ncbi:hypothetical protein DL89DRAFT_269620 [Linderina pennispora]|uniref:Peptide hydrolase n=1 Tax=Linderina pennispora TaxID=61395 RepID=A0A1Y1W246_9FUNG|nr:uncharacterized protein DL89DRAFT_269620 [Linderina pennispora]ORX67194.1 hypothetical protein DL89DRAFT_269620 [Linderina pennispora]
MAYGSLQSAVSVRKFANPSFAGALSNLQLKRLARTATKERTWLDIHKGELLAPVLVPRQVGSAGYRATQGFIVDTLSTLGYAISWDNFTAATPEGQVKMANIIATKNPAAQRRLVLSAHYESKVIAGGEFIGATDSAVPVALMLDVARGLSDAIDEYDSDDVTLQLVFFDGEEAYHEWSATDSLYGSRHLAEFWEHNPDPATAAITKNLGDHRPELDRVDLMVLMDLMGAPDNMFAALQVPTASIFTQLAKLEERLYKAGALGRTYMNTSIPPGAYSVDDDHRPFIERDVPVLHLISVPFPKAWHTLDDNADALDQDVIEDLSVLMRSFVASYLQLRF